MSGRLLVSGATPIVAVESVSGSRPRVPPKQGAQQAPGAGTSSPPLSPAPSLSPLRSSFEDGGFYGGDDGEGGGDGFSGEGDVFVNDGDCNGEGGGCSNGDGDGLGGGLSDGGGSDDDGFDDHQAETPAGGRAIPNRRHPQFPGRQVWSRAGMSVERQAAHRNANVGEAMRRSINVYDPLGIL